MWKLINILHKSWRLASKHNDIKTWKMCLAQRNVHVSIRQWCLHDGAHLEGAAVKGQPPDPTCWLLSFQMMFISLHIIIDINYVQNLSKSMLYNSLHWIWTDYVPDVHLQCIPLLYILHLSKSPKIFLWYPLIHDPFLYISMIFPWYFFTSLYPLISHDLKMSMISHDIWNIPPGLLRNVHGRHRYPATPPRFGSRWGSAVSGPNRGPGEAYLEAIHERKFEWFVTENEGHTDRMILSDKSQCQHLWVWSQKVEPRVTRLTTVCLAFSPIPLPSEGSER